MARSDYEHWNEERDIVWWQEEGRHHNVEPDYGRSDTWDDYPEVDYCEYCGEPSNDELGPLVDMITSPPVSGYRVRYETVHEKCGSKSAADQVR